MTSPSPSITQRDLLKHLEVSNIRLEWDICQSLFRQALHSVGAQNHSVALLLDGPKGRVAVRMAEDHRPGQGTHEGCSPNQGHFASGSSFAGFHLREPAAFIIHPQTPSIFCARTLSDVFQGSE